MNNIIRKRVVITVEEKLKAIKQLDASKLVAVGGGGEGTGEETGRIWNSGVASKFHFF